MSPPRYRPGNRALEYIVATCQPMDPTLRRLVESLPETAVALHRTAQEFPSFFDGLGRHPVARLFRRVTNRVSPKYALLVECTFDLMLTVYFREAAEYCKDNEIASALADALLFEAIGVEPSSPTESEIWDEGTHRARGIAKYKLADQLFKHLGDVPGWVFAKEVAVLRGQPKDVALILSIELESLPPRMFARWAIRLAVYGQPPSEEDREALRSCGERIPETLRASTEMLKSLHVHTPAEASGPAENRPGPLPMPAEDPRKQGLR